jgi:hypothetical protein
MWKLSVLWKGKPFSEASECLSGQKKFIVELKEEVDNAVDRAMAALERKKFSEAEKILNLLMQTDPEYHMVLYGMGVFLLCKSNMIRRLSI